MARLPRLVIAHQPHHVIQRGNNRQAIFADQHDYQHYLGWLREAAKTFKVAIHAYVLMPNHVHLLASPADETGLSRMMQWIGRQYVPYFNRKYQRTGTLWEGRYRATVVDSEKYFLLCSRYIELNPLRAGLVGDAEAYAWSSLPHHLGVRADSMVTDHALYWGLGNTPFEREVAYKNLINIGVAEAEIKAITDATLKGWALGTDQFKNQLARQTTRRISPAKRGRPPRAGNSTKPPAAEGEVQS